MGLYTLQSYYLASVQLLVTQNNIFEAVAVYHHSCVGLMGTN